MVFRFLLPVLQMQVILEAMTRSEIRKSMRNLSANLHQAFENTIQRIDREPTNRRQIAMQSLTWLSHALRPLRLEDLLHALATQIGDVDFDEDNLLQPRIIVESCFGLVVVDEQSSTVRLVHFTLQNFLQSYFENQFAAAGSYLTKTCPTYLCFSNFKISTVGLGVKPIIYSQHKLRD